MNDVNRHLGKLLITDQPIERVYCYKIKILKMLADLQVKSLLF
jgi:hypothetical protein